MKMSYEQLHKQVLQLARNNKVCVPGYKDALGADDIGKLCIVIKKRWSDVNNKFRPLAAEFFSKYYVTYKEEFQRCGIFYNCDADSGLVFIHNAKGITVAGSADTSIYGDSEVTGCGNSSLYATDNSHVILEENASATLEGKVACTAIGRNTINAREASKVIANGPVTIDAGGNSIVNAHQWVRIKAFGDAEVIATTSRGIQMLGNKKITLKPRQK